MWTSMQRHIPIYQWTYFARPQWIPPMASPKKKQKSKFYMQRYMPTYWLCKFVIIFALQEVASFAILYASHIYHCKSGRSLCKTCVIAKLDDHIYVRLISSYNAKWICSQMVQHSTLHKVPFSEKKAYIAKICRSDCKQESLAKLVKEWQCFARFCISSRFILFPHKGNILCCLQTSLDTKTLSQSFAFFSTFVLQPS